jgi:hypothetical protein
MAFTAMMFAPRFIKYLSTASEVIIGGRHTDWYRTPHPLLNKTKTENQYEISSQFAGQFER